MAIRVRMSKDDIARGTIINPGWYLFEITGISQKKAKGDDSMNTIVDLKGLEGSAEGVPVRRFFSEKAPGFFKNFIEAITGEDIQPDVDYNLDGAVGSKISVYIANGEYNGKPNNQAEDFRKAS